jgi:hypothetical protein
MRDPVRQCAEAAALGESLQIFAGRRSALDRIEVRLPNDCIVRVTSPTIPEANRLWMR